MTHPTKRTNYLARAHCTARRGLLVVTLALAAAAGLAPAKAAEPATADPPAIPALVSDALTQPRLAGEGRLRWLGFQVYDARLFVPGDGMDPARYARSPFALELKYARKLLGEEIAQASVREMQRMGFGTDAQRAGWLEAMRALFPDVATGDRLTGVHQLDGRVVFFRNDSRIGRVEDRQFGEAFFGIWLDPRTAVPELRRALLQNLSRDAARVPAR